MVRNWEREQIEALVNPLEVERVLMEEWCRDRDVSYIHTFIDYQNRLIDYKERECENHAFL